MMDFAPNDVYRASQTTLNIKMEGGGLKYALCFTSKKFYVSFPGILGNKLRDSPYAFILLLLKLY